MAPLLVSFTGRWFVRLPLVWEFAVALDYGTPSVWAAHVIEYYGRAYVTTLRFRIGRWKALRV